MADNKRLTYFQVNAYMLIYQSQSLMHLHSFIRALAGSMVLLGLILSQLVSPAWLLLPAFVAINLIQSAFTGFCPPSLLLRRVGWIRSDETIAWGGVKAR